MSTCYACMAWVYCGATHPECRSDCKFVTGHTGTHMAHGGLEWSQTEAP